MFEIDLPHIHINNIGGVINNLMGGNANFPGPVLPQSGLPKNSLTLLGSYLDSYQFQILRLLPFISRYN